MDCPSCKSHRNVVHNQRNSQDTVYRTRRCLDCGRSFATYELRALDIGVFDVRKLSDFLDQCKTAPRPISEQELAGLEAAAAILTDLVKQAKRSA